MPTLTLGGDLRARAVARLGLHAQEAEPARDPSNLSPDEARRRRKAAAKAFHERVAADSPATFCRPGHGPLVALAVGIHRQLAVCYPDVPKRTLRRFLGNYVRSAGYLALLCRRPDRRDLDGQLVGTVTEDEAAHAAAQLAARAMPAKGTS